jgi:hypothetical protein
MSASARPAAFEGLVARGKPLVGRSADAAARDGQMRVREGGGDQPLGRWASSCAPLYARHYKGGGSRMVPRPIFDGPEQGEHLALSEDPLGEFVLERRSADRRRH